MKKYTCTLNSILLSTVVILTLTACADDSNTPANQQRIHLTSSQMESFRQLNSNEVALQSPKIHGQLNSPSQSGRIHASEDLESPVTAHRELSEAGFTRLNLLTDSESSEIVGWKLNGLNDQVLSENDTLIVFSRDGNYYMYTGEWHWGFYYINEEVTQLSIDGDKLFEISLLTSDSLILIQNGGSLHFAKIIIPESENRLGELSNLYRQLVGKKYVVFYHVKPKPNSEQSEQFRVLSDKRNWGVDKPDGSTSYIDNGVAIFKYEFKSDSIVIEHYFVREEDAANALEIPNERKIERRFDRNAIEFKANDTNTYLSLKRNRNQYDFTIPAGTDELLSSMSFVYGLDHEVQFIQHDNRDCTDCYVWALISEDNARTELQNAHN